MATTSGENNIAIFSIRVMFKSRDLETKLSGLKPLIHHSLAGDLGQFIYLNFMILKIGVIIIAHRVVSRLNELINVKRLE